MGLHMASIALIRQARSFSQPASRRDPETTLMSPPLYQWSKTKSQQSCGFLQAKKKKKKKTLHESRLNKAVFE